MKIMSFILREMRLVMLACFVTTVGSALAQQTDDVPFNGIVTDLQGKPLKGARIWTTDERRYATSTKEGCFGLTNVLAADTIHIRYKKVNYNVPVDGKKSARIRLANECAYIDEDQELVDIGYGFVKRRECAISQNRISGEDLVRTGKTFLLDALQGKVAGLYISNGRAIIRGMNSLTLSNEPLYILDGVEVDDFDMVSLYDVDYVEVLKDSSIYGAKGANGVIIVRTKR